MPVINHWELLIIQIWYMHIYIYIYLYDYCAWIVNKQQQTNTLLSIKTENSSLICYNDWCDCSNYQTLK